MYSQRGEETRDLADIRRTGPVAGQSELPILIEKDSVTINDGEVPFDSAVLLKELPKRPEFVPDYSRIVVIEGIPTPPASKLKKLMKLVYTKIIQASGAISAKSQMKFPTTEDGNGAGCIFISFNTTKGAKKCVEKFHETNTVFGPRYTIKVTHYPTVASLSTVPEVFTPPPAPEMTGAEIRYQWLLDDRARPQFLLATRKEISVAYFDDISDNQSVYSIPDPNGRLQMSFSPQGSLLLGASERGVICVLGPQKGKVFKLPHSRCTSCRVSPCERYALTFGRRMEDGQVTELDVRLWSIWEQRQISQWKRRSFIRSGRRVAETMFQFSGSGEFVSCLQPSGVEVWRIRDVDGVPDIDDDDSEVLRFTDVEHLMWSPANDVLSILQTQQNGPASCTLLNMRAYPGSTKRRVAVRSILVDEGRLLWHPEGRHLCLATRAVKKGHATGKLVVFRVADKHVPIEIIDVPGTVLSADWQPQGNALALSVQPSSDGSIPTPQPTMMVLEMSKDLTKKNTVEPFADFPATKIKWSPTGRHLVAATLSGSRTGPAINFYNSTGEVLASRAPKQLSGLEWEPTGRYLLSWGRPQVAITNSTYNFWSCVGHELDTQRVESLTSIRWRPISKDLLTLTDDESRSLRRMLREEMSKLIEEELRLRASAADASRAARARRMQEWNTLQREMSARRERILRDHSKLVRSCFVAHKIPADLSYLREDGSDITWETDLSLFVRENVEVKDIIGYKRRRMTLQEFQKYISGEEDEPEKEEKEAEEKETPTE